MIHTAAPVPRSSHAGRLLVVDDDRRVASQTAQWLCSLGWHAGAVGSADEALPLLGRETFAACIVDGLLPGGGTGRIAASLRQAAAGTGLVITVPASASAALRAAIEPDAIVPAPASDKDLLDAINTAVAAAGRRAAAALAAPPATRLLGTSPAMRRVHDLVQRLADAPTTLLITGESGTGKSLLAREIHRASRRRHAKFVEVACGCLSETLLESELFGHVAGSFTGATANRDGKFLQADGGTIFLDEIATASPALQVKLLRVLQDLQFEPVGGMQTHVVDARVILATHEDLGQLVEAGTFRADLFWRVNVITIEMPSLRDRPDDIPVLADHFLAAAVARGGRAVEGFAASAVELLTAYGWPGNVRELEHAVEYAVLLGRGPQITDADLPPTVRHGTGRQASPLTAGADAAGSLKRSMVHPERRLILESLERHNWRRDAAARALGINRTTLYKKLKRLGMNLAELQPAR
ncbi:MAG: sigma 54-interacting transcriptional regulator [Planctomycetia bacterium]